jgi:hypothetical protein
MKASQMKTLKVKTQVKEEEKKRRKRAREREPTMNFFKRNPGISEELEDMHSTQRDYAEK